MKVKNIYFDKKARLYMLIESAVFGDRIDNRKLGFNGLDAQITFVPSVWSGRKESLDKFGEGRLILDQTQAPLAYNQLNACDQDCPHLVKKIRRHEYNTEKGCYVKNSSLIGKVRKVHKNPIIERVLPPKSYKLRMSVWGDVSRIEDENILYLLRGLILNSIQHFAYSVNPPLILKGLVMKSESNPFHALQSLKEGHSVYFGSKDQDKQDLLKDLVRGLFPSIQCLSLGDGDPYLPTCGTCRTPCDGRYIKGKPKLILASIRTKSNRIKALKQKALT